MAMLQSILEAHKRRLGELRKRAALSGNDTPPAILLEIEDITHEIAQINTQLAVQPVSAAAPETTSNHTSPLITAPSLPTAGGDAIIATVNGSQNVAVGKNITQQNGANNQDADRQAVTTALDALETAMLRANPPLEPGIAAVSGFQVNLLRSELLKPPVDGPPSANVITQVSEWLLTNTPVSASPLRSLFTAPACLRLLQQSSPTTLEWIRHRFG